MLLVINYGNGRISWNDSGGADEAENGNCGDGDDGSVVGDDSGRGRWQAAGAAGRQVGKQRRQARTGGQTQPRYRSDTHGGNAYILAFSSTGGKSYK